jgi:hypothetical protein
MTATLVTSVVGSKPRLQETIRPKPTLSVLRAILSAVKRTSSESINSVESHVSVLHTLPPPSTISMALSTT